MPRSVKGQIKIAADLYKGMPAAKVSEHFGPDVKLEPSVELRKDEHFNVKLEMTEAMAKKMADRVGKGKVSISLEALDLELQHNQSFGMVAASTGCISNPGGPSC
jgi:hypothetical protein